MEVNPSPSLKDDVHDVLQTVPAPIREFLTGPDRNRIISEIAQKHRLHADQAGIFEKHLIVMLLGILPPPEFLKALSEAAITDEASAGIVSDVNEQIFKPLQEKIRTSSQPKIQSTSPKPLQTIQPRPIPPPPANLPGLMGNDHLLRDHEESHIDIRTPRPAPTITAPPSKPIMKEYGVDPYREVPE